MAAAEAHFEVVRTDAGWHGRYRAKNGRVVWTTEVYTSEAGARGAVTTLQSITLGLLEVKELDERETKAVAKKAAKKAVARKG